jgi:hypothetical protein
VFIASGAHPKNKLMRLWKEKVAKSTFARSPALVRQLNYDAREVREQHKIEPILTYDGTPLADKYLDRIIVFDLERINLVVEKIVRCLFFYHFGRIMPTESKIETHEEHDLEIKISVITNRKGMVGREDGEFVYSFTYSHDHKIYQWFLLFYLERLFVVNISNA